MAYSICEILDLGRALPVMSSCERTLYAASLFDPSLCDFSAAQISRWDSLLAAKSAATDARFFSAYLKSDQLCKTLKVERS
jgi:hypothetical protein